ncbi:hypothetical protein MPTK1_4g17660 [Marchantia polymorpha subsp. ruderalis]|uniref:Uncharacterized protein n=2 Tax=Marchantia polymorpha TaxID=3197 RepID=A0AAF6BAX4_MARPO|nr:hypothetical protein MARPO_0041s0048 [Marchantia polymorpha]BBN09158.1 hypothetical protein Mp_4g17660 [Marchantia polymorpha subsp. ruderalis]|eukprot:PTQ40146.1 hypothetical protein MARPO_0041s0048 [Marchantia polymorpha]
MSRRRGRSGVRTMGRQSSVFQDDHAQPSTTGHQSTHHNIWSSSTSRRLKDLFRPSSFLRVFTSTGHSRNWSAACVCSKEHSRFRTKFLKCLHSASRREFALPGRSKRRQYRPVPSAYLLPYTKMEANRRTSSMLSFSQHLGPVTRSISIRCPPVCCTSLLCFYTRSA